MPGKARVLKATPEAAERLAHAVRLILGLTGGAGVQLTRSTSGLSLAVDLPDTPGPGGLEHLTLVLLTAAGASDGLYEAKEVHWDPDASEWADVDGGLVWGGEGSQAELRELSGTAGLEAGDTPYLARLCHAADGSVQWVFQAGGGGAAVELFEVVSQTAGVKVVGKMLVGGEVPEGAADVDLLAPFVAWKVEAADTVAGYQLPDGMWRLLSEPPASAAVYQSPQVDSDGLLIFDYPRAHA